MTQLYPVLYEWAGKNFSGYAPDVPGCIATARSLPKMRRDLKAALEAHLQWLQDDGESIPAPNPSITVDLKEDPKFPYPAGYYVIVEKLPITMPRKRRATSRKTSPRELTAA